VSDFITMVNRIAAELRRSNMTAEIKSAINDAINREASLRFFFNEVRGESDGYSFPTVVGQEYYPDLGFVEVDAMYYYIGQSRYDITPWNDLEANRVARGGPILTSQPEMFSRAAQKFRIYPIPNQIITIYVDGYGRLTPTPLVADNDTNAWMTDAELLTRARAKAILLKDVIRDYGEATVLESIAADYRTSFMDQTTLNNSTSTMKPTQW
jgi:hypothetical protein